MKKLDWNKITELVNQGLNDVEVAKIMGCSFSAVSLIRKQLNLPKNFKYTSVVDIEKLKHYYFLGYSDAQISRELGKVVTSIGVRYWRVKLGLKPNDPNKNSIFLTTKQKEIIIGTVLGDTHLRKSWKNTQLVFAHSIKQQEYFMWKYEELKPLTHQYKISDKSCSRYKNPVIEIRTTTKCFKELNYYHQIFYKNKKKVIPLELIRELTPLSLAVWFMDDGYTGGNLSTNSFTKDELKEVVKIFKEKFNLDYRIFKNNALYLRANSLKLFKHLVEPYIIPSLKYKLIRKAVLKKSQELLETPKTDNQQPSLDRNIFEGSTTNSIPLEQ